MTLTLYGAVIICDCVSSGITPARKGLLCFLLSHSQKSIFKRKRGKRVKGFVAEACVLTGYGRREE
uniref:Uncharacterized protein n=1 Tax=Klebsiella pneumoniae TaxID=573 RepID=A0A6G9I181_KLEPN|nr:Hypothetical protein [Klebsiella pneumoniae]